MSRTFNQASDQVAVAKNLHILFRVRDNSLLPETLPWLTAVTSHFHLATERMSVPVDGSTPPPVVGRHPVSFHLLAILLFSP